MPDYKTDHLPIFYQVFTSNCDPDTIRDHEIEFLYQYRYGESNLTVAEKKSKLYEENPGWIYCNDDEERDFILSSRHEEQCFAMANWFASAGHELQKDGMHPARHHLYPENNERGPLRGGYAILPKSRWKRCAEEIGFDKKYDYSFVGAWKVDPPSHKVRQWVYDFDKYTDSSFLKFTDKKTKENYIQLGSFDKTLTTTWGRVQKELDEMADRDLIEGFDEDYYKVMCASKFVLCPAGDAPWSMRMYEALMCKAIPIVMHKKETYRSHKEQKLGYKFYYANEEHVYREDWVEHNYNLFMNYHTYYGS
ncbi:MAG: exostosin family protein [Candidatus Neomarinimicrobiota bacterium]|jgi:hypothetical protein